MFDFQMIIELLRADPGHGFVQATLLAAIWWECRGSRKEVRGMRAEFTITKTEHEKRLDEIEGRVSTIEQHITKE